MGFRFRKSFKLMPGVKINLSKSGVSTTIGGRGASVNVSKRGTYVNTSLAGFSSRSKVSGGSRRTASSAPVYVAPKTPQPASTRWFSFGVTASLLAASSVIGAYIDPTPGTPPMDITGLLTGIAVCLGFGVTWWFVRKSLRSSKQAVYERYTANQQEAALAAEQAAAEAQRQHQLAIERAAAEAQQQKQEREAQRLATFAPQLERARQLHQEGIITAEQLQQWEKEPDSSYASPLTLEFKIDMVERPARAEIARCKSIRAKYDEATADKLIRREISTGMNREHVLDSLGETTKRELALTKEGERETLIYGSKTAGSYFHIINGIVTKAVVR